MSDLATTVSEFKFGVFQTWSLCQKRILTTIFITKELNRVTSFRRAISIPGLSRSTGSRSCAVGTILRLKVQQPFYHIWHEWNSPGILQESIVPAQRCIRVLETEIGMDVVEGDKSSRMSSKRSIFVVLHADYWTANRTGLQPSKKACWMTKRLRSFQHCDAAGQGGWQYWPFASCAEDIICGDSLLNASRSNSSLSLRLLLRICSLCSLQALQTAKSSSRMFV